MNGYILSSEDYGDTWERVELPFKFGGNMPGRSAGERRLIQIAIILFILLREAEMACGKVWTMARHGGR